MQTKTISLIVSVGLAVISSAGFAATNYYVCPTGSSTPEAPYTNWTMAADSLEPVIGLARGGDTITVSNGVYELTQTISITHGITLESADCEAPELTVLDGGAEPPARTGLTISHSDAVVRGFTIKNFGTTTAHYGADVSAGRITDCVITGCYRGAQLSGNNITIISNCTLTESKTYGLYVTGKNNKAVHSRFTANKNVGIYLAGNLDIEGCVISNNNTRGINSYGANRIVNIIDSDIVNNTVNNNNGAGLYIGYGNGNIFNIDRCRFLHNRVTGTTSWGGGAIYWHTNAQSPEPNKPELFLRNSLIAWNESSGKGGGILLQSGVITIENCTIVSNRSTDATRVGGISADSVDSEAEISNTIVYYNVNGKGEPQDWSASVAGVTLSHVCTPEDAWTGTIDNPVYAEPGFVDLDTGNFELLSDSPCVNAGLNNPVWMEDALDLAGHRRIDRAGRRVDIGCYEYLPSFTLFHIR